MIKWRSEFFFNNQKVFPEDGKPKRIREQPYVFSSIPYANSEYSENSIM